MGAGRFAPSPSGALHLGNLRTAVLAWLFARSSGRDFLLRMEDLDRAVPGADAGQLADLAALGLDWDGPVVYQSDRRDRYAEALETLKHKGLTYECFCTRREIREATAAPHGAAGGYPGICRDLTSTERRAKRAGGRPPAIRLRAEVSELTVQDELRGSFTGTVDDVVLRRNDGVAAYNLAVVVDDADQGIDQVVRGDDLLDSTPRQVYVGALLGLSQPAYAHVPLARNPQGDRLAKRDGAVTLSELVAVGHSATDVLRLICVSFGMQTDGADLHQLVASFDPSRIPTGPWVVDPDTL